MLTGVRGVYSRDTQKKNTHFVYFFNVSASAPPEFFLLSVSECWVVPNALEWGRKSAMAHKWAYQKKLGFLKVSAWATMAE